MNNTETNVQQQSVHSQLIDLSKKLQNPLSTLIALNNAISNKLPYITNEEQTRKLVENSRKIVDLVDDLVVNYSTHPQKQNIPIIFGLYETIPAVRDLCTKKPNSKTISRTDLDWLEKLENTVLQEVSKRKIQLSDLAYELAVSERQLYRNIKKFIGMTPNNYIKILKLYKAKQYLENYEFRTIAEVSHAVGFTDTHYFTQVFLNQYGASPKNIRPNA